MHQPLYNQQCRDDWPYSLSPGGLASNGYNGHTFWDCETWMYPGILLTRPNLAMNGLLGYRLNHQAGAALKAESYHRGYNSRSDGITQN